MNEKSDEKRSNGIMVDRLAQVSMFHNFSALFNTFK